MRTEYESMHSTGMPKHNICVHLYLYVIDATVPVMIDVQHIPAASTNRVKRELIDEMCSNKPASIFYRSANVIFD